MKQARPPPPSSACSSRPSSSLLAAGWFALIAPKRSEATQLQDADRRPRRCRSPRPTPARRGPRFRSIRVADLFELSRAMPNRTDMPDVLLQLSHVAGETGVTFQSITPHDPVPLGSYQRVGDRSRLRGPLLRSVRLPLPAAQPRRRPRGRAELDRSALLGRLDLVRRGRPQFPRGEGDADRLGVRLRRRYGRPRSVRGRSPPARRRPRPPAGPRTRSRSRPRRRARPPQAA